MKLDQIKDVNGNSVCGFFVRNKHGKVLAVGAKGSDRDFLVMRAKRYERDKDLVRKCEQITGLIARI